MMVDKVEAPDPTTVVFHLKFATTAFLPALADPYAWIYKKEILDKDPHWYEKNIMGSGPFKFAGYELGQSIKGVRNPDYYHEGLPYLDGFIGIYAPTSRRSGSTRSAPTAPPSSSAACRPRRATSSSQGARRQDHGAGERLELRQPGHAQPKKKPFDDVRVRKALLLAIDQWHGAPALPRSPTCTRSAASSSPARRWPRPRRSLQQIAGFWPDIDKSRAEASGC